MGYVEIHSDVAHRCTADQLAAAVEDHAHICAVIERDSEAEARILSQFVSLHSKREAHLLLVVGSQSFDSVWLKRDVEFISRLIDDQDDFSLEMISFMLVGDAAVERFRPVQVICTFLHALVRCIFQFPRKPYMSLKDSVHP